MKSDAPKGKSSKKMKNCRRWRRRSSNLTTEFKAKKGWLETHLWHAKRCKMIDYWGCRIAAHLNEKSLKSSYRSSINGALLHDLSYWQPFWMDSCNSEKLTSVYGDDSILDIIIEHEDIQLCPIKIYLNAFDKNLLLIHPAAIETGILDHIGFLNFLQSFEVVLSNANDILCTFKLQGSQSEPVLSQFLNLEKINNYPLCITIKDPRTTKEQSGTIVSIEESYSLFRQNSILVPSENEINIQKSELFITSSGEHESQSNVSIVICRKSNEFYMFCPRKWARIIWHHLIKIKPVKVAGINQIDVISYENEIPIFPRDFVGSPAYEIWSESEKIRLETIYNRKPPAKRLSYAKFGIESPFKPQFHLLGKLRKAIIEIEGRGIITDFAEIYSTERILIGYATTASKASLKKGRSTAIASVNWFDSFEAKNSASVLVRNHNSPDIFRNAKLSFISKFNK